MIMLDHPRGNQHFRRVFAIFTIVHLKYHLSAILTQPKVNQYRKHRAENFHIQFIISQAGL